MATRPEVAAGVADVDLSGRTAFVTGATSGIGRETALALGRLGARVLVHGRDRARGTSVVDQLHRMGARPVFLRADFADQAAVRGLAEAVAERTDRLDVLVNNAGAHFQDGRLTDAGVERTFAVNHLAPFLLTNWLRPTLSDGGRVVTVSSGVHSRAGPDDLTRAAVTGVDGYDGLDAYARSKLANVLFTAELARRADRLAANCCHPGFVPGSGIWRDASLPVSAVVGLLARLPQALVGRTVDSAVQGAATPVFLAASPRVADVSGAYFEDCTVAEPSAAARDADLARRLWTLSAELTGVGA